MNLFSPKNLKIILLAIVLLIVISLGGYFIYTDTQTKQTNRDFVFDVVKSLDEVHESRGSSDTEKDKENEFLAAYSMKEHVGNAENLMKKWENDKDTFRKEIARDMLVGIANLKIAAEAYINLLNKPNKEDLALFKVKLDEGREKLWTAAAGVVLREKGIRLSSSQKQEVIDFVDRVFENELKTFEEKGQDEGFSQPQEVWAAIMIRNGLSK